MAKEFDPNQTVIQKVTSMKRFPLMMWLTSIGTVGAAIIALNTFTGLNFRPAWGYETEQLAAADVEIGEKLDRVLQLQGKTTSVVTELKKGQLDLRVRQIDQQKREINRELAGHRQRILEMNQAGTPIPRWLNGIVSDLESTIKELDAERRVIESKQLELTQ